MAEKRDETTEEQTKDEPKPSSAVAVVEPPKQDYATMTAELQATKAARQAAYDAKVAAGEPASAPESIKAEALDAAKALVAAEDQAAKDAALIQALTRLGGSIKVDPGIMGQAAAGGKAIVVLREPSGLIAVQLR